MIFNNINIEIWKKIYIDNVIKDRYFISQNGDIYDDIRNNIEKKNKRLSNKEENIIISMRKKGYYLNDISIELNRPLSTIQSAIKRLLS